MSNKLILEILKLVQKKRDGVAADLEPAKVTVLSYLQVYEHKIGKELDLYLKEIESVYLTHSKDYYYSESNQKITVLSVPEYVSYTSKRIQNEIEIAKAVLLPISIPKVESTMREAMISSKLPILQEEFKKMVEMKSFIECAAVYDLIAKVEGALSDPIKYFEDYVHSDFQQISAECIPFCSKV